MSAPDERLEAARIESVYRVTRRVGAVFGADAADDLATEVILYLDAHRPSALGDANGNVAENDVVWALEKLGRLAVLPFGVDHVDALQQPFCACGRTKPNCDGSRKGCRP